MALANNVEIPHKSYPYRMVTQADGTLAVNVDEQDSLDEIVSCVNEIVACPVGAWIDEPAFGVPSMVFSQAPVGTTDLVLSISQWEPRAALAAQEYPDAFNDATRNIQVDVSAAQPDQ